MSGMKTAHAASLDYKWLHYIRSGALSLTVLIQFPHLSINKPNPSTNSFVDFSTKRERKKYAS
jgi:hypothetical protein